MRPDSYVGEERGRGTCCRVHAPRKRTRKLRPWTRLGPDTPGFQRFHRKRGRMRRSYNANGSRERGGINFLWRERERLRWRKLRCEGEGDGFVLTRQTIFLFFLFFDFSFLPVLEWKKYEKGLILFGERYWNLWWERRAIKNWYYCSICPNFENETYNLIWAISILWEKLEFNRAFKTL